MKKFAVFCLIVVGIGLAGMYLLPGHTVRRIAENGLGVVFSLYGIEQKEYTGAGRPFRYWHAGDINNPTVILLHGAGGDALTSWFRLLPELSSEFSVYALQLDYSNLSEVDDGIGQFFWEQGALLSLLESEGVESASLVGLSTGSWLASLFAGNYPHLVNKIVMLSPMGTRNALVVEPFLRAESPGEEFARKIFYSPPPLHFLFTKALGAEVDRSIRALRKIYRPSMLAFADTARQKGHRNIPALLLWGEYDQIIPKEVPEALCQVFTSAELHVVPDAGHALVWDAGDRLAAPILSFLRK